MNTFKITYGNLITNALAGHYDVIAQGCNCFNVQGGGISGQFKQYFFTSLPDWYKYEGDSYKGDINKLGMINYAHHFLIKDERWTGVRNHKKTLLQDYEKGGKYGLDWDIVKKNFYVVNAYTQYQPGADAKAWALKSILVKLNNVFEGLHIGLPLIAAGIGGLKEDYVIDMMKKTLTNVDVTLVKYNGR